MNPELAKRILNITVKPVESLHKSFYEFDLRSREGIISFLTVLPITSDELLMQACEETFPGYVTDSFDVKLARLELQGYFLDYLEANEDVPETLTDVEEPEVDDGTEITE